jgi:hypothetical protein
MSMVVCVLPFIALNDAGSKIMLSSPSEHRSIVIMDHGCVSTSDSTPCITRLKFLGVFTNLS